MAGSRLKNPLLFFILALAVAAAYSNTLDVPLLLDDELNILQNPPIRSPSPPWAPLYPTPGTGIAGRPIANFSFALNWAVSGASPWSYHLFNILIHILSGLTLFGIVRRGLLTKKLKAAFGNHSTALAFLCALVWSLHPLTTEAVTYVTQRIESLAGLFYFLTLYSAIRSWETDRPGVWRILCVLAFLGGCGSKEIIVTAPFLVFLFDLVFIHDRPLGALKKSWGDPLKTCLLEAVSKKSFGPNPALGPLFKYSTTASIS